MQPTKIKLIMLQYSIGIGSVLTFIVACRDPLHFRLPGKHTHFDQDLQLKVQV